MSRKTIVSILIVLALLVTLSALGCSSAAPTTKPADKPVTPAQTTTTPPASKPAPTTPASTTPPSTAKPLSFQATTVTDDKNGFTLQHPKDWQKQPDDTLSGYYVYNAKSPSVMPNFYVSIYPFTDNSKLTDEANKVYKSLGGSDINWGNAEDLAWGDIKGQLYKVNWNYPGGYNLDTWTVYFSKGDKAYAMAITVMADGISVEKVKEVFTTFKFTK